MSVSNVNCSIPDAQQGAAVYLDCRPGADYKKDYFEIISPNGHCPDTPPSLIQTFKCMESAMGKFAQPDGDDSCAFISHNAFKGILFGSLAFILCAALVISVLLLKRSAAALEEHRPLQTIR